MSCGVRHNEISVVIADGWEAGMLGSYIVFSFEPSSLPASQPSSAFNPRILCF